MYAYRSQRYQLLELSLESTDILFIRLFGWMFGFSGVVGVVVVVVVFCFIVYLFGLHIKIRTIIFFNDHFKALNISFMFA